MSNRISDQTISAFRNALMDWYSVNQRSLPWRNTRDPYRIWVSEVMLQQTQVKTVLPYYLRFVERFDTLLRLAEADLEAVLKAWQGLGYYARARNLHRAAKTVAREYNGVIPSDWERFRKLPGVGEYIASAVLSIAFGRPHAVVDGNVKRVLARVFKLTAPVNRAADHGHYKDHADTLMERSDPGGFNQAMMEIGALVCRPARPECGNCPVHGYCCAFRTGSVEAYPLRIPTKPVPTHRMAVGVIWRNRKVLITQRQTEGLLGGLWEFPGGRIRSGEGAETACNRILKNEVGLDVQIRGLLTRVKHAYTHFKVDMDVFSCRANRGRVRLASAQRFRWIRPEQLGKYPFHKSNLKFAELVTGKGGEKE